MKQVAKTVGIFAFVLLLASPLAAKTATELGVKWSEDYTAISFVYLGKSYQYPESFLDEKFPPRGTEPEIEYVVEWPVVAMRARWTISAEGWPEKYRHEAIDLILMFATSAGLYEQIFPKSIKASSYTFPPEFLQEAVDPEFDMAEKLRGQEVAYEVTARGGLGAADYKIRTKIRMGLSRDAKTIFYFDKPDYISDYLTSREFLFAGRDEGGEMHFEIILLSVCQPTNWLLRQTTIGRVQENGRYFVGRLYEALDKAPTEAEIEHFFGMIRSGRHKIEEAR